MTPDIQSVLCSTYKNAFSKTPVNVSLSSVLERIRSDTALHKQISTLRRTLATQGKAAYTQQKTHLPAAMFAGTFTYGSIDGFSAANGFMICDLDDLQDARGVKELVAADEHVFAAFLSPNEHGVKFLVAVPVVDNAALFSRVFSHVSAYFADVYGIELDKSGSDISRLCFLSADADIIINSDVTPFEIDLTVDAPEQEREQEQNHAPNATTPRAASMPNDNPDFRRAVLQVLAETSDAVTDYADFFRVLAACKRENISYADFDAICQNSAGYNAAGNAKTWERFDTTKPVAKACTFGTLYAYATKTDEQQQRLNTLLPRAEHENAPEYLVNDTDILTAAAMPNTLNAPQLVDRITLQPNEWCLDWDIPLTAFSTEVNAPCNYGKTAAIRWWVSSVKEEWIVVLTPTTPLREDIAANYLEFYEVKEGDTFPENKRICVATRDKFVKSYPFERLQKTLVVIDEIHLNTIDISYKGRMLADLQAKLDYCRTLEMTGTPVRFPHHTHPVLEFVRTNAEPIDATLLYYADTLPTIRDIVRLDAERGLVPVFFLNDKDAIQEAGEMLLSYLSIKTADKRPFLVYRDDATQEITPDAKTLLTAAAIPANCLCILTTSLFEVGINLKSRAGTVVMFPRHKDHSSRRQMLAAHLPHEVVQSVSRFRRGWERLYIAIPCYQKLQRADFDYTAEYREHIETAAMLATAYNKQKAAKRFFSHVSNIRADISAEHRQYLRQTIDGAFVVYEQGIDFLLLESMRQSMTGDPVYYAKELASGFTPVLIRQIERHAAMLTQEEKAGISDIRADLKQRRADEWQQELTRLSEPETVLKAEGERMTRAERWVVVFSRYIGKDAACKVVASVGDEPQQLALLQRQARREKYLANKKSVTVATFDKIDALVQTRKEWESSAFMKAVKPILKEDVYLCHMTTGKSVVTRWTTNRAVRILEMFAGVSPGIVKDGGKTKRIYQVNTLTPFRERVERETGTRLETFAEWTKYVNIEQPEKTTDSRKTGRKNGYTFSENCINTALKSVTAEQVDAWWEQAAA